jgi:glycosyltransferase involved in cell wall biosynthesis
MPKLSIIIPCYNCAETLAEAVNSCFSQGFAEPEFEIVLVDDASTDSTTTVMKDLSFHHHNIQIAFHDTNKGGGATRNTAAQVATADVLFCLDSDDILPPLTLQKMYTHLTTKKCDGVGINTSVKFIGSNTDDVDIVHTFIRADQKIELSDLLQKDGLCSLYSTFMITRTAFDKIGGYPTHHGFDTQGFAWRFLAAGLYAETCPQATYLHRVQFHESYYLREYNNGKTNFNWLEIFKENFYLFNDEAQRFIKTFDCRDFTRDIFSELVAKSVIFAPQKNNFTSWEPYTTHKPVTRNSLLGLFFRARSKVKSVFKKNPRLKSIILDGILTYEDITTRLRSRRPLRLLFAYTRLRIKKLF